MSVEDNAPDWADTPDALCYSKKRYCKAHHEGFHSMCRSCIQESIYDALLTLIEQNKILILKP